MNRPNGKKKVLSASKAIDKLENEKASPFPDRCKKLKTGRPIK